MEKTISKSSKIKPHALTSEQNHLIKFALSILDEEGIKDQRRLTFSIEKKTYVFTMGNTQLLWQYIRHSPKYVARYSELKKLEFPADLFVGALKKEFGLLPANNFLKSSTKAKTENLLAEKTNEGMKDILIASLDPSESRLKNFQIGFGLNLTLTKANQDRLNPYQLLQHMNSLNEKMINQYELIFLSPQVPTNFKQYFFEAKAAEFSQKDNSISGGLAKAKDAFSLLINYVYFSAFAEPTSGGKITFIKELNCKLPASFQLTVRGDRIHKAIRAFENLSANAPWSLFPFAVPNSKI